MTERTEGPALEDVEGEVLGPGRHHYHVYPWSLKKTVHIAMVGGGGGGGGASDTHDDWASTGKGGGGGKHSFQEYHLETGSYYIEVGRGGAGGVSRGRGHRATDGAAGGETYFAHAESDFKYGSCPGGAGGKADAHNGGSQSKGERGGDVLDEHSGAKIATGGDGGTWMHNGKDGIGPGAGGGGQGGTRLPRHHGGNGIDGMAKITFVR